MVLDKDDLKWGKKFIVGTWQVDFLVNAFSNDLAHIPAEEFKSEDGTDFTVVQFEFFEDHTMVMRDTSRGVESKGDWEQTGPTEFHYTVVDYLFVPDGSFKEGAETLDVQDGKLVFTIGFLAVALKKIADGIVTKEPGVGETEMSSEDQVDLGIVGRYDVVKSFVFLNDDMGFFTREEVQADVDKKIASGEMDEDEAREQLMIFDTIAEFSEDHLLSNWIRIPAEMSQEEIAEAVGSGDFLEVKDGMGCIEKHEWKALAGKYYYQSGEDMESPEDEQSSWTEITYDEDGLMNLWHGMCKMKRI